MTAVGAAAAAAARLRAEEEKMTTYNKDDMDGWEFKIVRANTRYFKKAENLRRVCEEEAKAGWMMLEKFDDTRVRFKRRVDKRGQDQFLQGIDPYRSQVGIGNGPLAATVLGIVAACIGVLLLVVFYLKSMD